MAKQNYGINDVYRGRVGTVIGYQWRGQWCLRARPLHVRNPRTELQQEVRGRFAVLSRLASGMVTALRRGMKECALQEGITECNLFISLNREALQADGTVDYSRVAVATGPVAPVGFGAVRQEDGVVKVAFERNPLHLCSSSDDEVRLFAYCSALQQGCLSGSAPRRQREVAMVLPDEWSGREVHLYGFVQDAAGRASVSAYVGCLGAQTLSAEPTAHHPSANLGTQTLSAEPTAHHPSANCQHIADDLADGDARVPSLACNWPAQAISSIS